VNSIVKAVQTLRALSPEDFKLAVSLARPDKPGRKKPGPKKGFKRTGTAIKPTPKRARRIEPEASAE
jgi:hypothetical protein